MKMGTSVIKRVLIISLLALLVVCGYLADARSATIETLAAYRGRDRQQMLEAGARKEGRLMLYTSGIITQAIRPLVAAFEKRYPYVKVEIFRAASGPLTKRTLEEYQAGQFLVDAFETTPTALVPLKTTKALQPFYSPHLIDYSDDAKVKADADTVYYVGVRESYIGVGYNTKLIPSREAPKTNDDLLDPKWKGKMSVAGSDTGVRWLGNLLELRGMEFVKKLSAQGIRVQNVSGRALADMVISGEVPLSPTIFDSHVDASKQKGAPIEWVPLEPTVTNLGSVALAGKTPHPHAALMFLDFLLSEDGQRIYMGRGYGSPHTKVGGLAVKFKKTYLEQMFSDDVFVKKVDEWQRLLQKIFIRK